MFHNFPVDCVIAQCFSFTTKRRCIQEVEIFAALSLCTTGW